MTYIHPSPPTGVLAPAMTLTQLRYLVAIADAELNITLAATRVHATQPGLSKQLKQLEDERGLEVLTGDVTRADPWAPRLTLVGLLKRQDPPPFSRNSL